MMMPMQRSPMRRYLIPVAAFVTGAASLTGTYVGFLAWAQGWDFAILQFRGESAYVVPIILAFGMQASLYSVLRFRLFAPAHSDLSGGAMLGTSGGTSATSMVACCLHHVTSALPILGLSAATAFVARHQQSLLQVSLAVNLIAILVLLALILRAKRSPSPVLQIE